MVNYCQKWKATKQNKSQKSTATTKWKGPKTDLLWNSGRYCFVFRLFTFYKTVCLLFCKQFWNHAAKLPRIPTASVLFCFVFFFLLFWLLHNWSKALEMSRERKMDSKIWIPRSNDVHRSCYIDVSWFTVESPGINPDWDRVIIIKLLLTFK